MFWLSQSPSDMLPPGAAGAPVRCVLRCQTTPLDAPHARELIDAQGFRHCPQLQPFQYIGQRIESVLNQTYPDFELLILDDMSPDNSREIIERYRQNPA